MKRFNKVLGILALFSGACLAQVPDCIKPFQFTANASTTSFDNRQTGCINWIVAYQSSTFSAISLVVQSATGATSPGTYGTYAGTVASGINPNTNTTGTISTFTGYYGWMRVTLASSTGTGTVTGVLYGYKNGYYAGAGGGAGTCGALAPQVTGTCNANVVAMVNGIAYPATGAIDSVPIITVANATAGYKVLTNCTGATDAVQYNTATHAWSCRTISIAAQQHSISFTIDGGGSAITTGALGLFPTAAYSCTINRIDVSADQSGSITVDIWKAAGAIPTGANKISASAPATLATAQLSQNGSLSGWTTAVSSGDVFGGTIATVATVTRVTIQLWCS